MRRIIKRIAFVLLAAAALISCDPGPAGIFSLLEQEEPLNKGTAALNANTAQFVVRVDGATNYYYTAVGSTLLRRPVVGETWETVLIPGAPAGSIISSGVSDAGVLYISFAPVNRTIYIYDEEDSGWTSNYQQASLPDAPVQSLLFDGTNLYASTSTSEDKATFYTLSYSTGAAFSTYAAVQKISCGKPSAAAIGAGRHWVAAGNVIFKGNGPDSLGIDANTSSAGIDVGTPVFDLAVSGGTVIASGTGKLFKLEDSGYTPSSVFGSSDRRLSSVVIVPKNGGGNATVVGVKPWASDDYTGYYEYDAADNASFATVSPDTAYTMISTNSNYVTTLDNLGVEGFYYDAVGQRLFARTVMGGLWSNSWSGTAWSGWDRE